MPMSYRIDPEQGIVFITLTGDLNIEEFRSLLESRRHDPEYDPAMPGLIDAREGRFVLESDEMRELATMTKTYLPASTIKRAIVVNGDLAFGLARMFQMLMGDAAMDGAVFRDYDKALAWLKQSES